MTVTIAERFASLIPRRLAIPPWIHRKAPAQGFGRAEVKRDELGRMKELLYVSYTGTQKV
jgi:hypothetical protein